VQLTAQQNSRVKLDAGAAGKRPPEGGLSVALMVMPIQAGFVGDKAVEDGAGALPG